MAFFSAARPALIYRQVRHPIASAMGTALSTGRLLIFTPRCARPCFKPITQGRATMKSALLLAGFNRTFNRGAWPLRARVACHAFPNAKKRPYLLLYVGHRRGDGGCWFHPAFLPTCLFCPMKAGAYSFASGTGAPAGSTAKTPHSAGRSGPPMWRDLSAGRKKRLGRGFPKNSVFTVDRLPTSVAVGRKKLGHGPFIGPGKALGGRNPGGKPELSVLFCPAGRNRPGGPGAKSSTS